MNEAQSFDAFKSRVRDGVEEFLARAFAGYPDTVVHRAAMYAALGGGHRWRAMATIAAGTLFEPAAFDLCLPCACGVELAHAASLVLDDLPSMDNATLRRGRPCLHLAYPRWAVDLTPVFLVTMAYETSLALTPAPHERRVAAAVALSQAGLRMIAGQEGDLTHRVGEETEPSIVERYRLKTGEGFAVAARAGAILCGASAEKAEALYQCGMALGIAYQIADDLADKGSAVGQVGKSVQQDRAKRTLVDVLGAEGAQARADRYRREALALLDPFGPEAERLRSIVARATCW